MARKNYIIQTDEHRAEIYVDRLPDCAFVNAIKSLDICTARLLSNSEKASIQRGSPDVEIISMDGNKMFVTRQQLCSQYTHCSGRKIKLQYLRTNVKYIVYAVCNQTCRVTKLPNNCTGRIGDKEIKPGSFITKGEDGSLRVLSPKLFRKAYKIPLNDVIKRHMNGGVSREFNIDNIYKSNNYSRDRLTGNGLNQNTHPMQVNAPIQPKMTMPQPQDAFTSKFNVGSNVNLKGTVGIGKNTFQNPNAKPFSMGTASISKDKSTDKQNGAQLTVIARLVDINKQLVGFMVVHKATGQKRQMKISQVKALSREHKIDNLMLITKEGTNIQYLRGNGVVIQNLPEILV